MLTQSQVDGTVRFNQSAALQPVYDFAVKDLTPKCQTVWRFKQSAQVKLHLTNKSDRTASFQLAGQGQTAGCYVEFEWPTGAGNRAPQADLKLAAGETISVPVRVTLPPPCLLSFRRQKFYFTVTSTLLAACQQRRSLLGHVARPPLIGPGLLLLGLVGVVVGLFLAPQPLPQPYVNNKLAAVDQMSAATPSGPFIMPVYSAGNTPQDSFETEATGAVAMTYQQMLQDVAQQYDLDWRILAEVAYWESHFNPWAIGRRNEMGLMQIMPLTWSEWAPQVGVFDPYDPYSNAQVAAAYLVYLRNYCRANGYTETYWMLIGYNWGPNNLRQLFQQGGGLEDVPERPRHYALNIVQLGPEAPIRRQEQLETVVVALESPTR